MHTFYILASFHRLLVCTHNFIVYLMLPIVNYNCLTKLHDQGFMLISIK
jgi:hypothetical protein